MTTIISIQVRMGSTRLPGKILLGLPSKPLLAQVIEQCLAAERPNDIVVAIGDEPPNEAIVEWCERTDCRYIEGPESNLLERHRRVAAETNCDLLVRITGDCPFVPPEEIDRLVRIHQQNDAVLTTNNTKTMPTGTAVDIIDCETLAALASEGATHPVAPLRSENSSRRVTVSDSERWTEFGSAHTAVDTPADYWRIIDAVNAVGTDPYDVTSWLATCE